MKKQKNRIQTKDQDKASVIKKKKKLNKKLGFPDGTTGKEPACQCRRHKKHRFDSWVRKIPWRRA